MSGLQIPTSNRATFLLPLPLCFLRGMMSITAQKLYAFVHYN